MITTPAVAAPEKSALAECEAVIARGMDTFVEVGNALMNIREERLYRAEFGTFQEYCEARWSMSDRHARRMIDAAEVADNIGSGPMGPVSERQARPLAILPPEQQCEAWQSAVESAPDHKPTAKHVAAAVAATVAAAYERARANLRPLSPAQASEEQQHQIAEAEKDSATLFQLKFYWRKAGKGDRARVPRVDEQWLVIRMSEALEADRFDAFVRETCGDPRY